eukprot:14715-Heterococcus_DN1.PRE.2
MFDAKYVATAMSIASQINWAFNFVVGIGFPVLSRLLGPWHSTSAAATAHARYNCSFRPIALQLARDLTASAIAAAAAVTAAAAVAAKAATLSSD